MGLKYVQLSNDILNIQIDALLLDILHMMSDKQLIIQKTSKITLEKFENEIILIVFILVLKNNAYPF